MVQLKEEEEEKNYSWKKNNSTKSAFGGSTSAVVFVHNVFSVEYKIFIWPPREAPNCAKCVRWSWLCKKKCVWVGGVYSGAV